MSTESRLALPPRWWAGGVTALTSGGGHPGGYIGGEPLVHVPDGDTALVLRTSSARRAELLIVGPRTRATYHAGKDFPLCLRIRLRPGVARLLLGVAVSELVDRVIPLDDVDGGPWHAPAGTGVDPRDLLERVEATLSARLRARGSAELARSELIRTAAEALAGRAGSRRESVAGVARRLGVSERHLRDLFTAWIGLSPKRFERIARVRRVLAAGRARTARWAGLAAAAGYYDQSHMNAEFRAMMGVSPGAFFAGRLPALEAC
ncbi:helix-turn-helix domain-containing protein [Nonomuraea jiangxiensis]|uniref:AraC-type DNA-binding protein n=1 Tax=Nonomuraea jiangxiensis TaxID=633440 RepID=A0A1G8WIC7_9ACTN|nr:helix-turn-helix domain-containing protein [Nonomuraea jiangxiensis]SDJ78089.1 AraC-type DNA-binding protein [Nonomuraea jiangxiensis]